MKILVHADHTIHGDQGLAQSIETDLENELARFGDRITRVEVHLSDAVAARDGIHDKECVLEARVAGLKSVTVSHHADHLLSAIRGASHKLKKALTHTLGRLKRKRRHAASIPLDQL